MGKNIGEATRERILKATLEVFGSVNFHQATTRQIARKAGVSQAAIYKYFENRDQLINALATEKVTQLSSELEAHLLGVTGALNKLRKMTWFYLHYFQQNEQVAWLCHVSMSYHDWRETSEAFAVAQGTGQIFRRILEEGQETGEVRQDIDFGLILRIYFGGLSRIIHDWLTRQSSKPLTSYADNLTEIICAAVKDRQQ